MLTEKTFTEKQIRQLILAATAYISLVIFSNVGSLRILLLAGLAVDGGTLLYPLSFTARDLLHKKAGARITRLVIILAAVVNLALFAFIWLIAKLPADLSVGAQTEYALVLLPGLRLVIGSITAMTIAELIDTLVYSRVRARYGTKRQWLRVLYSNGISVPIDTAIFLLIAFAGWVPTPEIFQMFIANLIIKYAVTLVSFGSVYLIRDDRA